jgi:hypothetical protein
MNNPMHDCRPIGPQGRVRALTAGPLGLLILLGFALMAVPAFASDGPTPQKMLRQIGVMEKIVDKVLIDSPNVLVSGMGNTRGLYVEPFGVVFTFTASILRGDSPLARLSDWSFSTKEDQYDIQTDNEGNQVITIKKGKKADKADKAKKDEQPEGEKNPETAWETERQQKYANAKGELVQALLDYGETMTSLKPGQFVLIAGFMKDDDFFKEEKISRFVLKAKVDDLRAFSSGELDERAMRSKISIEEY